MDDGQSMALQGDKTINSATFAQAEKYFSSALKLEKNQRFEWIDRVLAHDANLLQEVRSLLLAHHESDDFLTTPLPLKETIDKVTEHCPDLTGRRLGVYEVTRKIARGGMGSVYSAKRIDGEYEQVVAIKVVEISNINIELFLKERQLLADIQHPNIVTLLDGGTLEEGFPYLVMELVEGMAIDQYVECYRLSSSEIVKLCRDLCGVIDDAHQQGIIHCDLKPDNILVIAQGNQKGTLKLLDFGIAESLSVSHVVASPKSFRITPEYASPQRHYNYTPHRSDDVFSLGIILGQLLSGQPLSLIEKTNAIKKTYKSADLKALSKNIKNKELVQIFRKATAKKRGDRYASASEFRDDLNNWLDEKPISAVQGGWWYVYSKFLYRYRNFLFIIFIFAILSLIIGQIVGQYVEYQEKDTFQQEVALEAVDDLDKLLAAVPHTPSLEQQVTSLTLSRLQDWEADNPNNPTIKMLYADILVRMANISGHPYYMNLGNISASKDYYKKALGLYQKLAELKETRTESSIPQLAQINQHFIQHRLAELSIYSGHSAIEGWKEMRSIREALNIKKYVNLPSKQRRLVLNMLLSEAYESLRLKAYDETWALLQKAKKILSEEDRSIRDISEEDHYLQAFYYEIQGHLYFLEGNIHEALVSYAKISRPNLDDEMVSGRYKYLIIRVDSAFACMGFQQKSPSMRLQHFKYFEYARINLEKLSSQYHDVPMLQWQSKQMNNNLELKGEEGKKSFCTKPIEYLLPPIKTTLF